MNFRKCLITALSILWMQLIHCEDQCTSSECIHASASILEKIDTNVQPCTNFYDFACGTFLQDVYVPDEDVAVDSFTKIRDAIDSQVYALLNDPNDQYKNASYELSRKLFKICLNRYSQSDTRDVEALSEIIEKLGGWPMMMGTSWDGTINWTLSEAIQRMRKLLGHRTDKLFDISSFIINLANANNPLLRPSGKEFSVRNALSKYVHNVATFLGAQDLSTVASDVESLVDFEFKLNLINQKLQQLSSAIDAKGQSIDVLNFFSATQWLDIFHPSQIRNVHNDIITNIKSSTLIHELNELFEETSSRTLSNYFIWHIVDYAVMQSTGKLYEFYIRFRSDIDGRLDRDQSWKECIGVVTQNLPFAIGAVYINENFNANTKASVVEMFNYIKLEFINLINESKWIDSNIREKLLTKLNTLRALIAYPPDGFQDLAIARFYDDIDIDENQYLKSLFRLRTIDADSKFKQSRKLTAATTTAIELSEWQKYLPPTTATALYSPSDNTIKLSAGILKFVKSDDTMFLTYGNVGFIIAHELSHIVNQIFAEAETWPTNVEANFNGIEKCLVEQYNEYRDPDTEQTLNGRRTVIENIADNSAIKLAYRAYKRWQRNFTGKHKNLIGLAYNWDQMFWLGFAQTWCGVYRAEEITRKITSDSYAIERFRVIGTLQNSPDFIRDFECPEISSMNRKNKCFVW